MEYTANLQWDPEAAVWTATSDDINGLVLESGSVDALIERVRYAVPELLELNHQEPASAIRFRIERYVRLPA
ncbi:MAG: DUF1902 domain-containing protein [Oscillospiraceae bacterium]|jgi:hypothetical protein|nr:DUF1902 domain-containing protein [Oscillospiraceae bacterium]